MRGKREPGVSVAAGFGAVWMIETAGVEGDGVKGDKGMRCDVGGVFCGGYYQELYF